MSNEWRHTHNGAGGEKLYFADGKYYTEHAWQFFAEAYRGEVTPVPGRAYMQTPLGIIEIIADSSHPCGVDTLVTVDWGTDTETTENMALPWPSPS